MAAVAIRRAGWAAPPPFLSHFSTVSIVGLDDPANGDVNPYGIANVPFSTGALVRGDTLVSNFNASSNLQGTGTTIMEISPGGAVTQFAALDAATLPGACPGGVGLTTALAVLNDGYVIVGSLPVTDEGTGTPEAGCLIVLNSQGVPVETWAGPRDQRAVGHDGAPSSGASPNCSSPTCSTALVAAGGNAGRPGHGPPPERFACRRDGRPSSSSRHHRGRVRRGAQLARSGARPDRRGPRARTARSTWLTRCTAGSRPSPSPSSASSRRPVGGSR